MLEFSTYSTVTAKKEHTCSLCGLPINIGEKYIQFAGKYDGLMFDYKFHPICDALIDEYCNYMDDNEYTPDAVIESIRDRVCCNCRHYNDDIDDYEEKDCDPYSCEIVIGQLLPNWTEVEHE